MKALLIYITLTFMVTTLRAQEWQLVWADEFNYNGYVDSAKWSYDIRGNSWGWGNNEAQYYTERSLKNAKVEHGVLKIIARIDSMDGKRYTSARLVTKGKGDWLYGKVEVLAKLPRGLGTWPAIWMLPTDNIYGGWPKSGEIDILENVGYDADTLLSTAHTARYNHVLGTQTSGKLCVPDNHLKFHLYTLEWNKDEWRAYVDGHHYYTHSNKDGDWECWPFDQRFYLILNLAIGGNWGGKQGIDDSMFPHVFEIDYVRVYQKIDNEKVSN